MNRAQHILYRLREAAADDDSEEPVDVGSYLKHKNYQREGNRAVHPSKLFSITQQDNGFRLHRRSREGWTDMGGYKSIQSAHRAANWHAWGQDDE